MPIGPRAYRRQDILCRPVRFREQGQAAQPTDVRSHKCDDGRDDGYCRQYGDPRLLYEIITTSEAATVSNLFKELGARIAQERYEVPTFSVDLLIKDVRLAVDMAKDHQSPPLLARTVEFINEMAQAQGYGGLDTAIMWKCYRKIWGEKVFQE